MKKYILFLALGVVAIMAQANSLVDTTFTVVIDRGHDLVDQGAQVDGDSEYEILSALVAQITGEVKESVNVIYYNAGGERLTLAERAEQINALNPDLVISIHMDSNANGPRQASIILSRENINYDKSAGYANQLITHLSVDNYYATILMDEANLALLRMVNAPALTLQLGNMNAKRDRYYLQTNGAKRVSTNFTAFLNSLN